jgi:osmotically-inducible protein OsmY
MAGDDRWRYSDRHRGGVDRYPFESSRRYERDDREGTRWREADETFGRASHDYPAGSFGRGSDRSEQNARLYGGPYPRDAERPHPEVEEGYAADRADSGYGAGRRQSSTDMAFGPSGGSERDYRPGDFGRHYDRDHRGVLERAGDEVASWLGGDEHRRPPHAGQGYGEHRGRGPKTYQRSDDRIREDVNDRLTDDPRLDASEIEVTVAAREVTLSGTVHTRQDKRRAEDIVDTVSGVTHVQNNLRVQNAGGGWSEHQQAHAGHISDSPTGAVRGTIADPAPDAGEPVRRQGRRKVR